MSETRDIYEDRELVERNLERISENQQIKSDEALLHNSDTSSLSEHNKQYTALLRAYVDDFEKNAQYKRENKQRLFNVANILLLLIPTTTIILMFCTLYCLCTNKISALESLSGLFAALATMFGTFLFVPRMITKYLFNKKEEEHLADIISRIQEYDRNIREKL